MNRLARGLAFRASLPLVVLSLLMGTLLTLVTLRELSSLAEERLAAEMRAHIREVLAILNAKYDPLLRTGLVGDPIESRISLGRALGDLEQLARERGLAIVALRDDGAPLLTAGPVELTRSLTSPRTFPMPKGARDAAFEFQPWRLRVLLAHDARDFRELMLRVRGAALLGILALTVLAAASVLLVHAGLSRSVRRIAGDMKSGRPPQYKGIFEFEELSRGVADMMRDLGERERELDAMAAFALNNPAPVLHVDAGGRVLRHNPAAAGLLGDGLGGMAVTEALPALTTEVLDRVDPESSESFAQVEQDLGSRSYLLTIKRSGDGGWFVYAADITARREVERLRDDVERMARHDLKEPAVSLISGVRLLRLGRLDPDQRRITDEMERLAYRLIEMVGRTLALARMERGAYSHTPEPVDLLAVTRTLAQSLVGSSPGLRIDIFVDGREPEADERFRVKGEETLAHSVLFNFLQNAAEAAGGKPVLVDLDRTPDGSARIAVSNAVPVPEEMRRRFFEKYASAGKSHGAGLGAYAARLMTRAMGGDVVMRTSDEEGTRVEITLPLA